MKHGRRVGLVNFFTDEIGNPEVPKKRCTVQNGGEIHKIDNLPHPVF